MQLYGALLSPFARKAAMVAEEKGIGFELVVTAPHTNDPAFTAASPFGKIPALRDGDFTLCDSSAIVHYLEAKVPSPALLPADPRARGRAIWLEEFADTILGASALKILFNRLVGPKLLKVGGDEAVALQGEAELPALLGWLEGQTPHEGWHLGDAFTLADIALACVFASLTPVGHAPDAARHPRIAAWYGRVCARPAWQRLMELEASLRRPRENR